MEKNEYKNVIILIPSLQPNENLFKVIVGLKEKELNNIVIVDDGSGVDYANIFAELKEKFGCQIVTHDVNKGKGRALKTGFSYILQNFPDVKLVVTMDSDGQHTPNSVKKCVDEALLKESTNFVLLGVRSFNDKSIPFRSRLGNKFTSKMVKWFCGINTPDTQTGLRVFTKNAIELLIDVDGERFEYEFNSLLCLKEKGIDLYNVEIETVYIDENKSSHFRPIKDSLRIYSLFLKFIFSSVLSFLLDISLYALFVLLTKNTSTYYVAISTVLSRVVSANFNFVVNKKKVFKSDSSTLKSILSYYGLAIAIMCLSALGTSLFVDVLKMNEILAKIVVDVVLFIASFTIQRDFIFKNRRKVKWLL